MLIIWKLQLQKVILRKLSVFLSIKRDVYKLIMDKKSGFTRPYKRMLETFCWKVWRKREKHCDITDKIRLKCKLFPLDVDISE